MKRRKSGWRVALFGLLILGGIGLSSPEDRVSGGAAEEKTTFWNATDAGPHPSLADLIAGQTDTAIRTQEDPRQRFERASADKQFVVKNVVVHICLIGQPLTTECPFCVLDLILQDHLPQHVHRSTLRCPFPNEMDNEECAKDYTTRRTGYVKITRPGEDAYFDQNLWCHGTDYLPQNTYYCWGTRHFLYHHHVLGKIDAFGYKVGEQCSDYCIGYLVPLVNARFEATDWEARIKCPGSNLHLECTQLHPATGTIINLGNNDYCFKKIPFKVGKMGVEYHEFNRKLVIPVRRRCKERIKYNDCDAGYCLKRRYGYSDCGGSRWLPECLLETGNGSSLRISKHLWCCMDPNGCKEPVGRCSEASDCHQKYCVSVHIRNQQETRCPKEDEGETDWKDCEDLSYGETRWIEGKSRWCCVPKKDEECNYDVRSCGSNLSCEKNFCVGEKKGNTFRTSCPTDEKNDEECENLLEGHAQILSPGRVCCKMRHCPAIQTICGKDPDCKTNFCVAVKDEKGWGELVTRCPTLSEEKLLGSRCSVLDTSETIKIEDANVWCCKKSQCKLGDVTQFTTPTTGDEDRYPANTSPGYEDLAKNLKAMEEGATPSGRPTGMELLFAVLIFANVVACATCSVTVVCFRMLMFERKRARKVRRNPKVLTSGLEFEGKFDALLEKMLHTKPVTGPGTESIGESKKSVGGTKDVKKDEKKDNKKKERKVAKKNERKDDKKEPEAPKTYLEIPQQVASDSSLSTVLDEKPLLLTRSQSQTGTTFDSQSITCDSTEYSVIEKGEEVEKPRK